MGINWKLQPELLYFPIVNLEESRGTEKLKGLPSTAFRTALVAGAVGIASSPGVPAYMNSSACLPFCAGATKWAEPGGGAGTSLMALAKDKGQRVWILLGIIRKAGKQNVTAI